MTQTIRRSKTPLWHRQVLLTLVPQQHIVCSQNIKFALEQPEEHDIRLRVSTWLQIAPDLRLSEPHWTVLDNYNPCCITSMRGFTLPETRSGWFSGVKEHPREYKGLLFPIEHCTVAMINAVHLIREWF